MIGGLTAPYREVCILVGFIAAVITIFQTISTQETNQEHIRKNAVKHRIEAYKAIESEKFTDAVHHISSAERIFLGLIEENDVLSIYGLSIIYGDSKFQSLFPSQREVWRLKADQLWCRARAEGLNVAMTQPLFSKGLIC